MCYYRQHSRARNFFLLRQVPCWRQSANSHTLFDMLIAFGFLDSTYAFNNIKKEKAERDELLTREKRAFFENKKTEEEKNASRTNAEDT